MEILCSISGDARKHDNQSPTVAPDKSATGTFAPKSEFLRESENFQVAQIGPRRPFTNNNKKVTRDHIGPPGHGEGWMRKLHLAAELASLIHGNALQLAG
jgi:hypothetical protein